MLKRIYEYLKEKLYNLTHRERPTVCEQDYIVEYLRNKGENDETIKEFLLFNKNNRVFETNKKGEKINRYLVKLIPKTYKNLKLILNIEKGNYIVLTRGFDKKLAIILFKFKMILLEIIKTVMKISFYMVVIADTVAIFFGVYYVILTKFYDTIPLNAIGSLILVNIPIFILYYICVSLLYIDSTFIEIDRYKFEKKEFYFDFLKDEKREKLQKYIIEKQFAIYKIYKEIQ